MLLSQPKLQNEVLEYRPTVGHDFAGVVAVREKRGLQSEFEDVEDVAGQQNCELQIRVKGYRSLGCKSLSFLVYKMGRKVKLRMIEPPRRNLMRNQNSELGWIVNTGRVFLEVL